MCVTHESVMEALTARGVVHAPEKENTVFSPYKFVGGKKFEAYEIFPYHIELEEDNQLGEEEPLPWQEAMDPAMERMNDIINN